MSNEHFQRAIIADPADDLPRLVYADWLDENNDPARAEFIRVQCELAKLPEDDPRRSGLEDREHELLEEHEPAWLGESGRWLRAWEFRRGFVGHITCGWSRLLRVGDTFFDAHPVTGWAVDNGGDNRPLILRNDVAGLNLFNARVAGFRSLEFAAANWDWPGYYWLFAEVPFPRLESLDLSRTPGLSSLARNLAGFPIRHLLRALAFGGRSGANFNWADAENETLDAAAFVAAMADAPLENLAASDCGLTTDGLRKLLTAPFAPRLTALDISDNPIAPDAWRAFRQADPGMRLKRLDVSGTPLAGIALEPMLGSPALEELDDLEMNRCGSARKNMEVVARSAYWTRAVRFRAHGGTIPASTLEPLCKSDGSPHFRLLDLADNYLRTEGVRMLCNAPWAGGLTWLALSRNYLDDESLTEFAFSGRFTRLRTLHLAHNNLDQDRSDGEVITDTGIRRLAAAQSLAGLRLLTLGFTGLTDRSVDVLLNAPYWRLSGLGIDGCDLSPDAVRMLAASPRLARLNWLNLGSNPRLSGDALLPLAESPYLSRLCELNVGGVYVGERTLAALRGRLGPRLSY
jgi:uncharacterized protein (TIGR02996 family)